jgi:predicted heme/steroid binding protein/uncharacterized membrane protein
MRAHIFILTILLIAFFTTSAGALEEYALKTGKECSYCHLSRTGGGELTAAGKRFERHHSLSDVAPKAAGATLAADGAPSRLIRFVSGYIHLLVAMFWFGTILYVHLVLKPAYASQGLPRGEVRVGLASMAAMALTGAILAHYRITSSEALFQTRFGILLLVKVGLFAVMVISALVVVFVIGPRLRAKREAVPPPAPAPSGTSAFTTEGLAFFDGSPGRPAYVAYNGTVYDASASVLWKGGTHVGRHPAGRDLTPFLDQAPHGEDRVLALPCVGTIARSPGVLPRPLHERIFFFMAYLNLTMVFLISLIVALWRWW